MFHLPVGFTNYFNYARHTIWHNKLAFNTHPKKYTYFSWIFIKNKTKN